MTALLPKLRTGLTVSPQGTAAVLMDPARRDFFRLGEVERYLVERCDGATPADEALAGLQRDLDTEVTREALDRFLDSLERAGLLDSERGRRAAEPPERARRIRGSLLYLRLPLADPDRFLDRIVDRFGFLYSRVSVLLGLAVVLTALCIAVVDWGDIVRDAGRLYRWSAVPEIWLTAWAVVAAHELAHGLTCKRFGGEVHEMGFMLIYFQPAAYCNVSDAWLFPEKRQRVLVTLAGPWLELCLWGLATLAWRVTDPEAWVHEIALIVVATSGLKTLLNLNPLLKFDGYYLLSDLLDIPNLRRRAFQSIGGRILAWFGRGSGPTAGDARERRVLLVYGVLASVISLGFLGVAFAKLGRYLTQDRVLPFALALGFLSVKLPRKLRRMFTGDDDDEDPLDDDLSRDSSRDSSHAAIAAEPRSANGTAAAPSAAPSSPGPAGRTTRTLAWLAGAAAVLAVLGLVPVDLKVRGAFRALPGHDADVRALVDGVVAQVCVHEGDSVRPGDVVARLATHDLDAQIGEVLANIEQAEARLRLLLAGPRPADVAVAQATLKTVAGHLPYARDRLALNRTLFERDIISRQELKLSEEQAVTAEHELAEARERLRSVSAGPQPDEIAAARAELRGLEVRRDALEQQRGLLEVRCPGGGVVATPEASLHDLVNRHVGKGDLIAEVYDDRVMAAEIGVSEQDIADVHVGQRVALRARAHPGVTFHGTVAALAVSAEPTTGTGSTSSTSAGSASSLTPRHVLVTTQIDNHELLLRPEMTGQAKIVCGRRTVMGLITRRLARTFRVEFWSWS